VLALSMLGAASSTSVAHLRQPERGKSMGIVVQPRNGDSFGRVIRQAVQILRDAKIPIGTRRYA
jgi:hypothetical protein